MNYVAEDILMHYGRSKLDGAPGVGSGRYPLGSGKNPNQHQGDFLTRVSDLRKSNFTYTDPITKKIYSGDTAIAKSMGLTTSEFRVQLSLATNARRQQDVQRAKELRDQGMTLREIADEMGFKNDSSVRSLLNSESEAKMLAAQNTAEQIKQIINEKGMIDVGAGVERELGISREKLDQALYILEQEGYPVYKNRTEQVTNKGQFTTRVIICPEGTEYKEVYDTENIHSLKDYVSHDNGLTFDPKWTYPTSLDSNRLDICYAEDGGINKDGLIEIRPGVQDLSLGNSTYSQVRILVDGDHYLKGMAVYNDDLPPGIDIRFNTNKSKDVPKMDVLKVAKDDPINPFGSLIKSGIIDPDTGVEEGGQSYYIDANGKKQLSLINKRADEGDWSDWSNKVPSQFLAKQNKALMDRQLKISIDDKQAEFDEIMAYTNPTVQKKLLESFANDCDSAAVHLQAAALPRQAWKVIIPAPSLKDNEVYAPHCKDGEQIALVRFPHGGTFEIPIVTVNNNNQEGQKILGKKPKDAIAINSEVARRLSGADFDGDTVLAIPITQSTNITSSPELKGLKGFDPSMQYGPSSKGPVKVVDKNGKVWTGEEAKKHKGTEYYEKDGHVYKKMSENYKQKQMGVVSNLITDMTIKGAKPEEIAKAVRHSMVVIDAAKHNLDYKQSEKDNDIAYLKRKYQGHYDENGLYKEGASTLLSKAKSQERVSKRVGVPKINEKGKPWYDDSLEEGALVYKSAKKNDPSKDYYDPTKPKNSIIYVENREYYINKKGKTVERVQISTKMAEARDARSLISDSDTYQERAYANYANSMKSMANAARRAFLNAGKITYNPKAKEIYSEEVKKLKADLNIALLNAPRERQAQLMAKAQVDAKVKEYPDMTPSERSKASQQALEEARLRVGAERRPITITERQWEAIQAGAVSESILKQVLDNTDLDVIKSYATPRTSTKLSQAKINRISTLSLSGYTTSEIADHLGVSVSTVQKYLSQS